MLTRSDRFLVSSNHMMVDMYLHIKKVSEVDS